jgi:AAA domain
MLIPRAGITVIWGEPKCGKSFWTFDAMMHVALGRPYRGRRIHQGPVVYCAFEGQKGFEGSIEAWRQRHRLADDADVPFYLQPVTMNLVAQHRELIEVIKDQLGDQQPAAIVLDTLNRSLQGSESSDEDMGNYVKAADALREAFNCAVPIVHHCGHDKQRPRGHSSLIGAADALIMVEKAPDGTVTTTVQEVKDGEAGAKFASRLERVELIDDEDGDPLDSCVIIPVDTEAAATGATRARTPKPNSTAGKALNELHHLIIAGRFVVSRNHPRIPDGMHLVDRDAWRAACLNKRLSNGNKANEDRAFLRAEKELSDRNLISTYNTHVWPLGRQFGQAFGR